MSTPTNTTSRHTNNIPAKGRAIKSQITRKTKTTGKENAKPKPMTKAQLEARIAELQGQYT
jgi:hypothetical protein